MASRRADLTVKWSTPAPGEGRLVCESGEWTWMNVVYSDGTRGQAYYHHGCDAFAVADPLRCDLCGRPIPGADW